VTVVDVVWIDRQRRFDNTPRESWQTLQHTASVPRQNTGCDAIVSEMTYILCRVGRKTFRDVCKSLVSSRKLVSSLEGRVSSKSQVFVLESQVKSQVFKGKLQVSRKSQKQRLESH